MAILLSPLGERAILLAEHVLGRSSRCDTRLPDAAVSSRHASIIWDGSAWQLRDLGSTNGTSLNGRVLAAGATATVGAGDRIDFGKTGEWTVEESSEPRPLAISLTTNDVALGDDSLILLPNAEDPQASIYLERGNRWLLETSTAVQEVVNGALIQVAGQTWRFHSATQRVGTVRRAESERRVAAACFRFKVSRDEERVCLTVEVSGETVELKERSHHYTLLTLARLRERDAADRELSASEQGWVDTQELGRLLGASDTKLSVEVCRIRQQLSGAGFVDAADIIERRPTARLLRIGTSCFEIKRE